MNKPTNDEVTSAVDLVRALNPQQPLMNRGDAREFIKHLAPALGLSEDEMLLRLANYHERHQEAVDGLFISKVNA